MSVLERFKPLPTAEQVVVGPSLPPGTDSYFQDTITLGWEERLRTRGRRTSDRGVEFGTALPRGTVLRGGDRLVLAMLRLVVTVVERAEPVLVIRPATPEDWGLYGYHIGNSHQPIMITADEIVCPDILGVRQILEHHRIPFTEREQPFTPVALNLDHRH